MTRLRVALRVPVGRPLPDIADTAYVLDHGIVVHHGPAAVLAADEGLMQSLAGASAEEWDLDKA